MFELGRNIGYNIEGIVAFKQEPDFKKKQEEAWELAKNSIDDGIPCYGWELDIPEYYVVYGYDDIGYYFSGPMCDQGKGPKPWQELADTGIGVLEMYNIRLGQAADDVVTVKEALEFAVEHAQSPQKWIHPKYKAGLAGYDNWIKAVDRGLPDAHGMAYNSALWAECRTLATHFLQEASQRLNGEIRPLLEEAGDSYFLVSKNLHRIEQLYPFPPVTEIKDSKRDREALDHLKKARKAEEAGLETLKRIVNIL